METQEAHSSILETTRTHVLVTLLCAVLRVSQHHLSLLCELLKKVLSYHALGFVL